MARTSGGTAGPDAGLIKACEASEKLLVAPSIAEPKRYRHDCCFGDWIDSAKQSTCGNCNRVVQGPGIDENGDFL